MLKYRNFYAKNKKILLSSHVKCQNVIPAIVNKQNFINTFIEHCVIGTKFVIPFHINSV